MKKISGLNFYFLLISILLSSFGQLSAQAESNTAETDSTAKDSMISKPFRYKGYYKKEDAYQEVKRISQYVEMSDGTRLAIDVLIPQEGPPLDSFPVLLQFTPYNRSYMVPNMGPIKHAISSISKFGWGPEYDQGQIIPYVKFMLRRGYIVVNADMRGTGASFGSQMPMAPILGKDGKEMVDWIAKQEWCDGNVGMMGPSYLGWVQLMTAAEQPEALKCIMPEVIFFDAYSAANCIGGIQANRFLSSFSDLLFHMNRNTYKLRKGKVPALPAEDEDGDGKLADERPTRMDSASLFSDAKIRYRDGKKRTKHTYREAIKEHYDNVLVKDFIRLNARYYDSPGPAGYEGVSYKHGSPGYYAAQIAESKIPIYHSGGWFDIFATGTLQLYSTLAESNPSKLLVGPRWHLPSTGKAYREYLDYPHRYMYQQAIEQLRFFDHYLKGIDNGIEEEAPVYIYVMNGAWREETSWPIERQRLTPFYFQDHALMDSTTSSEGVDAYEVDFGVNSHYGKDSLSRYTITSGIPKQRMQRTEMDKRLLTYDSPILKVDTEITGHPIVQLWMSSNQDYGDLYVYLEEVDSSGNAYYVTEGKLRAGWHKEYDPDIQTNYQMEVKPELPWHGFTKEQYEDKPLADGKIIEMRLDLMPTAWLFRKGSKIRIALAAADQGNFEPNPGLCPDKSWENCPETQIKIHRSADMPSHVLLPIIPPLPEEEKEEKTTEVGLEEG
ncbi:MAG: CocE/NonD family hydrolase [Bacteroidota bacterium]